MSRPPGSRFKHPVSHIALPQLHSSDLIVKCTTLPQRHEMAVQLPSEAIGPAAGVLVYSFFCLSLSLLLLWLVWVHHERKSCKS